MSDELVVQVYVLFEWFFVFLYDCCAVVLQFDVVRIDLELVSV